MPEQDAAEAANPWLAPPTTAAADPAAGPAAGEHGRPGRPRAKEKRADEDRLPVRLTAGERARVEAAARAAGFGRVAPFVRSVVLAAVDGTAGAAPRETSRPVDGRVLSNLNQIARELNTAARTGQGIEDELLHRTLAAVEALAEQVAAL
jgi:hypothetical protein